MFEPESDESTDAHPERAAPAPILPLFVGVLAAVVVYLLWGVVGQPLIGIAGGIISGSVITALLLWRKRPLPPVEDDPEKRHWGE